MYCIIKLLILVLLPTALGKPLLALHKRSTEELSQYPPPPNSSLTSCNQYSFNSSSLGTFQIYNQSQGYLSNVFPIDTQYPNSSYAPNITCTWYIESPDTDTQIMLSLDYFNTKCASDFVVFSETATGNVFAQLCGNRMAPQEPIANLSFPSTLLSETNSISISFVSVAGGWPGFSIRWSFVPPFTICNASSSDVCLNGGTCNFTSGTCSCSSGFTGPFCENAVPPFSNAQNYSLPRYLHSGSWNSSSNSLIVYGGSQLQGLPLNASTIFVAYSYSSSSALNLTLENGPGSRYGHTAFWYNGEYYVYGGTTNSSDNVLSAVSQNALQNVYIYHSQNQSWSSIHTDSSAILYGLSGDPVSHTSVIVPGPLSSLNTTYVPVIGQQQIPDSLLVFGGSFSYNNEIQNIGDVLQYSLRQNKWSRFGSFEAITPGGGYSSGTGFYHTNTNAFYLFNGVNGDAGYPVYIVQLSAAVQIPMLLNYSSPAPLSFPADGFRMNASMQDIGNDQLLFFGGFNPYAADPAKQSTCFRADLRVYDLACRSWSFNFSESFLNTTKELRAGAATAVYTNGSSQLLAISSGSNGELLEDILTINLTSIIPSENATEQARRNACRSNWCSEYQYSCGDCLALPYCHYCNGSCTARSALLGFPLSNLEQTGQCVDDDRQCSLSSNATSSILLNTTVMTTVSSGGKNYFEAYIPTRYFYGNVFALPNYRIDFSLYDLALYVDSIYPSYATVNVVLQNYQSNVTTEMIAAGALSSSVSINNRFAIFASSVRQPGLLQIAMSNSFSNTPVTVAFRIIAITYQNNNDSSSSNSWILSLPILFCVLIGGMAIGLASSFVARRCRGENSNFPLNWGNNIPVIQENKMIEVPEWWQVEMFLPGQADMLVCKKVNSEIQSNSAAIVKTASMEFGDYIPLIETDSFAYPLGFESFAVKADTVSHGICSQDSSNRDIEPQPTTQSMLATHHLVMLPSFIYTTSQNGGTLNDFVLGTCIYSIESSKPVD